MAAEGVNPARPGMRAFGKCGKAWYCTNWILLVLGVIGTVGGIVLMAGQGGATLSGLGKIVKEWPKGVPLGVLIGGGAVLIGGTITTVITMIYYSKEARRQEGYRAIVAERADSVLGDDDSISGEREVYAHVNDAIARYDMPNGYLAPNEYCILSFPVEESVVCFCVSGTQELDSSNGGVLSQAIPNEYVQDYYQAGYDAVLAYRDKLAGPNLVFPGSLDIPKDCVIRGIGEQIHWFLYTTADNEMRLAFYRTQEARDARIQQL